MSAANGADPAAPPRLPRSAVVSWWLTAWLRGHESTDDVIDVLAEELDAAGSGLDLLTEVRRQDVGGAGLALPRPGDLLGLGGPAELNAAALESGEAVIAGAVAVVPYAGADDRPWRVLPAAPRQVPDLGESSRGLRLALLEAADALARLDVARWRPEVADVLLNLRHLPDVGAPHGIPGECVDLAARGLVAVSVVALALEDDGGAVSAYEVEQRRTLLTPLEAAGRRAIVAACSPEAWPAHSAGTPRG